MPNYQKYRKKNNKTQQKRAKSTSIENEKERPEKLQETNLQDISTVDTSESSRTEENPKISIEELGQQKKFGPQVSGIRGRNTTCDNSSVKCGSECSTNAKSNKSSDNEKKIGENVLSDDSTSSAVHDENKENFQIFSDFTATEERENFTKMGESVSGEKTADFPNPVLKIWQESEGAFSADQSERELKSPQTAADDETEGPLQSGTIQNELPDKQINDSPSTIHITDVDAENAHFIDNCEDNCTSGVRQKNDENLALERDSNLVICDKKESIKTSGEDSESVHMVALTREVYDMLEGDKSVTGHECQLLEILDSDGDNTNDATATNFSTPIKMPVVQEFITTLHSYRVESPKPMRPLKTTTANIKKSRSLDDDDGDFIIQELSDASSTSELNENQLLVSDDDSNVETETKENFVEVYDTQIFSVETLSLEQNALENSDSEEENPSENLKSEDVTLRRAKKRATLETHFMPQILNPRYLHSIKEESSDGGSDIERRNQHGEKTKREIDLFSTSDDLEDDVFSGSEVAPKKANAVFPKSTLDFSKTHHSPHLLPPPKNPVICEESTCITVASNVIENQQSIEKSCSRWKTKTVAASDDAEVIYIESTSSSSSDVNDDDTDVEDLTEKTDVRIDTPTIDVSSDTLSPSSSISSTQFHLLSNSLSSFIGSTDSIISSISQSQTPEKLEEKNCSDTRSVSSSLKSKTVAPSNTILPPPVESNENHHSKTASAINRRTLSNSTEPLKLKSLSETVFRENNFRVISEPINDLQRSIVSVESAILRNFEFNPNTARENTENKFHHSSFNQMSVNYPSDPCPSASDKNEISDPIPLIPVTPYCSVGESCANNMFDTLISPLLSNDEAKIKKNDSPDLRNFTGAKEFTRQDSADSHCSGHSQSTTHSQCTAINKSSSPPADTADLNDFNSGPLCILGSSGEFATEENHYRQPEGKNSSSESQNSFASTSSVNSLREICLSILSSMPYGQVALEELASVAESLSDLTRKHQESLTNVPYSIPALAAINLGKSEQRETEIVEPPVNAAHIRRPSSQSPPPIPRSFSEDCVKEFSESDKNSHRLLAIIRDSSLSTKPHQQSQQQQKKENTHAHGHQSIIENLQNQVKTESESIVGNKNLSEEKIVSSSVTKKSGYSAQLGTKIEDMPLPSTNRSTNFFDNDFFKPEIKRFSNIESSTNFPFWSELLQNKPKRYSNIETSSYESEKRIENGNVVFEFSDSNKQKYSNNEENMKTSNETNHTKKYENCVSSSNVTSQHAHFGSPFYKSKLSESSYTPASLPSLLNNTTLHTESANKNRKAAFDYNEFSQRAKESASRTNSDLFESKNFLLKDFDDHVSKYFKEDDFFKAETISNNKMNENNGAKAADANIFEIPIRIDDRRNMSASQNIEPVVKKATTANEHLSELKDHIFNIPIHIEHHPDRNEVPVPTPSSKAENNLIYENQYFHLSKSEKRLKSQNLEEWMKYVNDADAVSSENIVRPFQREVDICQGRRVSARAPRLTASTSNLSDLHDEGRDNMFKQYYFADPYNTLTSKRHSTISNSVVHQTLIPPYISSESYHEPHAKISDDIKLKEQELNADFDRLESDRRRLVQEMDRLQSEHKLHRNVLHYQSLEEEAFRQQMHNEWLMKVAEREERLLKKTIKISKSAPGEVPEVPTRSIRNASLTTDIGDEFLRRVKERRSKLQMPSDSDWESGAESQPQLSACDNKAEVPNFKIIEGQTEASLQHLPKHLREFAEYTDKIQEHYRKEESIQQTDTSNFGKHEGVWSPNNIVELTRNKSEQFKHQSSTGGGGANNQTPPTPPPLPVWSPQASPTLNRKEFRSVKFQSPTPSTKYFVKSQESAPSWSYTNGQTLPGVQSSSSCSTLNTLNGENPPALNRAHSSSFGYLQKGKGGSYTVTERHRIPRDDHPAIARPNEVIYSVKNEYMSEPETEYDQPRKMAQLERRKFEGIGPTTKDGMPIVLRSEVDENNQHRWYKRMYNTIHKAHDGDEIVTIRYKTRRGRYPYKSNGYMSEPERNYDSDYTKMKYHTLDRRRIPSTTHGVGRNYSNQTSTDNRSYGTMPNPVKSGSDSYKNQPGKIENFTPGHSSVSEKEKKEWWDEVMDIFNGHLKQEKLSRNYAEGYLSRALKEQGYESDSHLVIRKKEDSQCAPLSPVEQKQAYKQVQAGGEPPLQGFRKPAPEKPKDEINIENHRLTSNLTKMVRQKEIICYPITNISRPLDLFAPFPKNVPSFIPISPPAPPIRESSRTITSRNEYSQIRLKRKGTGPGKRHEACFQTKYYQQESSSNRFGNVTAKKQSKQEPSTSRPKSTGSVPFTVKYMSSTTDGTERSLDRSGTAHISKRQQACQVFSVIPTFKHQADRRKSSPSPVAFGRSISKERTFAEERKRLQGVSPLCRKSFSGSAKLLRDQSDNSPEIKVNKTFIHRPLGRSKSAPKNNFPAVETKSSAYFSSASKKSVFDSYLREREEKLVKLDVSLQKGSRSLRPLTLAGKTSYNATKSNSRTSRLSDRKAKEQTAKTESTGSLARTNSTFSIESTESKKRTETKSKAVKICHPTSRDYSASKTISGNGSKNRNVPELARSASKNDSVLRNIQQSRYKVFQDPSLITIEQQIKQDLNNSILQQQGTENFFQNLFLRDSFPIESTRANASRPLTQVQEKVKTTISSKSEPSRRSSTGLSQKRHVTDSRFFNTHCRTFQQSRSLSPVCRRSTSHGSHVLETVSKFDSIYQLSDEESEEEKIRKDRDTEEPIYNFEQRSTSEPRTKTFFTEFIRPDSPTVIHGKVEYEYPNSFTPTREVRSPSRRRIEYFREEEKKKTDTKKVFRASSLSSADQRSRRFSREAKERAHSAGSLNVTDEHGHFSNKRRMERFKELEQFYHNLERVGELEFAISNTNLHPIRKEGEIIDFDEWKKVRAYERAEKEFDYLVEKLKYDQREKQLLFRPKNIEDIKWSEQADSGLKNKEKSVEDLRETFERKNVEDELDEKKKFELYSLKDTYKPFWRGSSVVELASSMVEKYNPADRKKKTDKLFCFSNRLISTLSKEQVSKLKNQLDDIYSSGGTIQNNKSDDSVGDSFVITVNNNNKNRFGRLQVRCNSSISNEELLGPFLKRKESQISTTRADVNYEPFSLPATLPSNLKKDKRIRSRPLSAELSESDKKRLSQSLCHELQDKVKERKKGQLSPVILAKETRGATAAENAKSSMTELTQSQHPQEYQSIQYSHSQVHSSDAKQVPQDKFEEQAKSSFRMHCSSFGDSGSNISGISKTTLICKENPSDTVLNKIRYFEEKKEEEPPKIIYHAREYSSQDEEEVIKAIEAKIMARKEEPQQIDSMLSLHKKLSSSLSDFKEVFGEKETQRKNFRLAPPPAPPDKPKRRRNSSLPLSISEVSSESLLLRNKNYFHSVQTGNVEKIKNKFESLNLYSDGDFIELGSIRRIQSDPGLNKSFLRDRTSQHKMSVKGHEIGDVSWITHKFETKNSASLRGRSRLRKVVSPIPRHSIRKDDRLMPRIDVISKTAALIEEINNQQYPSKKPHTVLQSGEVERIRYRFESKQFSPDRGSSLLSQMYTSSPDISELRDISNYLSASWIAHKYPKPRDNARSPISPEKGPENEQIRRREYSCPRSTSPPRSQKSLIDAVLRPYYDVFADQDFDPLKHRPKETYVPAERVDQILRKNGLKKTKSKAIANAQENDVVPSPPPPPPSPPPLPSNTSSTSKGVSFNGIDTEYDSEESPRFRYIEGDVNIHYKTPIRYELKDAGPDEELARSQVEAAKKLYQEEGRHRKYLQELQDINSRRHTDNFIATQNSPIPLNRYDDFETDLLPKSQGFSGSRAIVRAVYNFQGQTARELTFKKGDIIYIRRQIDKNWYEGEHNAMVGLLPVNYVEIITKDGTRQPPPKISSEGQARAKFNFQAQSAIEISLNKGELVILTRRVDDNWFEGKIANRKGIFPVSYVEVLTDIGTDDGSRQSQLAEPTGAPASHSLIAYPNQNLHAAHRPKLIYESNSLSNGHVGQPNGIVRETKLLQKTEILHVDTDTQPVAYRALYKYRPQNNDELELQEGDIVLVLEKCDDGWYVGTSQRTGYFGTFPGNYVERA